MSAPTPRVGDLVRVLTGRHAGQIGTVSAAPTPDGWHKVSFDEGFGRYPAHELEPVPALPQRVRGATLTPSYVDVYRCPVAGCDYMVGAAGPIDPDEPDYHAEDVQAHRASHLDDGRVHDVAEAEQMARAEDAWSAYESLRDGIARQNRKRIAAGPSIIRRVLDAVDAQNAEPEGEPADIGEDDGVPSARRLAPGHRVVITLHGSGTRHLADVTSVGERYAEIVRWDGLVGRLGLDREGFTYGGDRVEIWDERPAVEALDDPPALGGAS